MTARRRASYVYLCLVPFLNIAVVGVRALRIPGMYQTIGIAYFTSLVLAALSQGSETRDS